MRGEAVRQCDEGHGQRPPGAEGAANHRHEQRGRGSAGGETGGWQCRGDTRGCGAVGLGGGGGLRDELEGRPAYARPLSPWQQVPASMAFVTDSNRPQPLWQPPPTASLTASGATSEVPSLYCIPGGGRTRHVNGREDYVRGNVCGCLWVDPAAPDCAAPFAGHGVCGCDSVP